MEKIQLEVTGSYEVDGKVNINELNKNLLKLSGLKYNNSLLSEQNQLSSLPAIVELDKSKYLIKKDGTVVLTRTQTINSLTKDNYGDYIDLGKGVDGVGTRDTSWRILYNDKINNIVYAILADYLPNNHNAVTESQLDKVNGKKYNVFSWTSREDLVEKFNNTTVWQSLIPEEIESSCQVKGAITAEILLDSYNEKYGTTKDYTVPGNIYFYINNDISKGIDTLYMPHPDGTYESCNGFWLATVVGNANHTIYVRSDGLLNSDGNLNPNLGIRPVVFFSSDTQVISSTSNGVTIWNLAQ